MAAEIHKLPRFEGERARRLPAGEVVPFPDALRLLASRAHEWRDILDGILQRGDYLMRDDGRDHVLVDGATLQACGEDMAELALHLRRLADLAQEGDDDGA